MPTCLEIATPPSTITACVVSFADTNVDAPSPSGSATEPEPTVTPAPFSSCASVFELIRLTANAPLNATSFALPPEAPITMLIVSVSARTARLAARSSTPSAIRAFTSFE